MKQALATKLSDLPAFEVSTKDLYWLISSTAFAMSRDKLRPYLNGVYLHVAGGELRAIASDGEQLSRASVALPDIDKSIARGVLIHSADIRAWIQELRRKNLPARTQIEMMESHVSLKIGEKELIARLDIYHFPDFERTIPNIEESVIIASLNTKYFRDSTKSITGIGNCILKLSLKKGHEYYGPNMLLEVSRNTPEPSIAVPVLCTYKKYEPTENLQIGVRCPKFLEILNKAPGKEITLSMTDARAPIRIDATEVKDGRTWRAVIMPNRLY